MEEAEERIIVVPNEKTKVSVVVASCVASLRMSENDENRILMEAESKSTTIERKQNEINKKTTLLSFFLQQQPLELVPRAPEALADGLDLERIPLGRVALNILLPLFRSRERVLYRRQQHRSHHGCP